MYVAKYAKPATDKELLRIEEVKAKLSIKPLDDDSAFLDDYTVLRFLRHRDGKVDKALKSLEACIVWRREVKPHLLTYEADAKSRFLELNKMYALGASKLGVPVVYYKPRPCHDPKDFEVDTRAVAWFYEEIHRRGHREILSVVDSSTYDRLPSKSERKAEEAIEEMTHAYYPLVDTRILLMNLPLIVRPILAISMAMMSSAQKDTMTTGVKPKHLPEHIELDQLSDEFGGTNKVLKETDERGTFQFFEMLSTVGGDSTIGGSVTTTTNSGVEKAVITTTSTVNSNATEDSQA